VARLIALLDITPLCESGRVFLTAQAPWLDDFLDELTAFPNAPHDDMVDALSMALAWLRGEGHHEYSSQPRTGEFMLYPPGYREKLLLSGETTHPNSPHYLPRQMRIDALDDAIAGGDFKGSSRKLGVAIAELETLLLRRILITLLGEVSLSLTAERHTGQLRCAMNIP